MGARAGTAPPWTNGAPPYTERLDHAPTGTGERAAYWRTVLALADLFGTAAAFDAYPGMTRFAPLRLTLRRLMRHAVQGGATVPRDGLLRIAEEVTEPLHEVLKAPNLRLVRDHEMVALSRVREQDARCLQRLAWAPGRTTREKAGTSPQTLAVVRRLSPDVAENRVVRRFCASLVPLVRMAIANAPPVRTHRCNETRTDQLRDLLGILEDRVAKSPLATIPPALRPAANNVLLSHRRYSRVWRWWRWYIERDDEYRFFWQHGPASVRSALRWLVLGALTRRRDAALFDVPARVRLATADGGADICPAAPPLLVVGTALTGLLQLDLDPTEEGFRVVVTPLDRTMPRRTAEVLVELEPAAHRQPRRGYPVNVLVSTDRDVDALAGHADLPGLLTLARAVASRLPLPSAGASPGRWLWPQPAARRKGGWDGVGIDLGGARALVCVGDSVAMSGPLVAARWTLAEGEEHWTAGAAAAHLRPDVAATQRTTMAGAWAALAGPHPADGAPALQHILATAFAAAGPARSRAGVALAVPDGLDEVAAVALRASMPPSVSHTWLIPRSVAAAAALTWGPEPQPTLLPGAHVLVVDAEGPALTASFLTLRVEGDPAKATPAAWYWERPSPLDPLGEARLATTAALLEAALRHDGAEGTDETERGLARRCVEEAFVEGLPPEPIVLPHGDGSGAPGWAVLRADPDGVRRALDTMGTGLEAWVEGLAKRGDLAGLHGHAEAGPIHLVLVGRLFSTEDLVARTAAALRQHVPIETVVVPERATIARGAAVFLARQSAGLPTWKDHLPALFLCVRSAGHTDWIRIFEEGRIRPGQKLCYDVPKFFGLPAGQDAYELPLHRGERSREELPYVARLEAPCFPLADDLRVRLRVNYVYAADSFRLEVRPATPERAPFPVLEVQWTRREGASASRRVIRNEPPGFPAGVGWDVLAEGVGKAFVDAAEKLETIANEYFKPGAKDQLKKIREALRAVERGARTLLAPSRGLEKAPPRVTEALRERVLPILCALAEIRTDLGGARRAKAARSGSWAAHVSKLLKTFPTLRPVALSTLSYLRRCAPCGLVTKLIDLADSMPGDEASVRALGRVVAFANYEEQRRGVQVILRHVTEAPRERVSALLPPFWACATALWSDEAFALGLEDVEVEALLSATTELMRGWGPDGALEPNVDLFLEAGTVLLGLLRRRDTEAGEAVRAGTDSMDCLAEDIVQASARLATVQAKRPPRLRLAAESGGDFAEVLHASLRGERVALVEAFEGENG